MPLISFGAILTFAETIEKDNKNFYQKSVTEMADSDIKTFFENLIKIKDKQIKIIQRIRRENVSEMILEPINDFTREPFLFNPDLINAANPEKLINTARKAEERNLQYYTTAAKKIKSLPEVATALKQLSKKQKNLLKQMEAF